MRLSFEADRLLAALAAGWLASGLATNLTTALPAAVHGVLFVVACLGMLLDARPRRSGWAWLAIAGVAAEVAFAAPQLAVQELVFGLTLVVAMVGRGRSRALGLLAGATALLVLGGAPPAWWVLGASAVFGVGLCRAPRIGIALAVAAVCLPGLGLAARLGVAALGVVVLSRRSGRAQTSPDSGPVQ